MRQVPLTIIPFATETRCQAVSENLTGLGYPVKIIERQQVFKVCLSNIKGVLVFLFGKRQSADEGLVNLLSSAGRRPRLGIFDKEIPNWDQEILEQCSEFSVWPCSEREIVARLDRLAGSLDTATDLDVDEAFVRELDALNIIGRSSAFMRTVQRIRKFSECDAPVLIEGETGTGKELAARAIHYLGPDKSFPFIPVNCGALPDNLIENELFGHESGAYTDAKKSSLGLIAQAEGGTLFLDEVEALSAKAQVTLLRFLQEKEYRPLGGKHLRKAHVRVVAATNTCLVDLVKTGEFRGDLLYRLNIMPLKIPALRQRNGDIELLAEYFLKAYRQRYRRPNKFINPAMMYMLKHYDWPGNVRELENLIHREFLLAEGDDINLVQDLNPVDERSPTAYLSQMYDFSSVCFNEAKARVIDEFEHNYLSVLLSAAGGNVSLAAKRAGKERRAFGKLLKKHGIRKESYL